MNIGLFTDCYLPTKNGVTTAIVQAKHELERRGHKVVVLTVACPENGTQMTLTPAPTRRCGVNADQRRGCLFTRRGRSAARAAGAGGMGICSENDPVPVGPGSNESVYRFPSIPFKPQIELRLGLPRQAAVDRIVAREKLDLIHTHTEFSLGWAGKRAALRSGLPLVHTLHTLYPDYRHYLPLGRLLPAGAINGLLARFLAGYTLVVCPSEKGRAYVSSLLSGINTAVIGNGASRERFDLRRVTEADRGRVRAALGIAPADRVILYVGRLASEKRVLALFAALRPLLHAHHDCRVLFVGAGPARSALLAAVLAAGLERQVLLTGPVAWEQMVELYAIAHAFVTVSLSEVHPMTLIEALMCGVPVVARREASICGLVLDGVNGFLVDSDRALAGKLAILLEGERIRLAFGRNAQQLAGRFTVETHVARLEALYAHVIEIHRREAAS